MTEEQEHSCSSNIEFAGELEAYDNGQKVEQKGECAVCGREVVAEYNYSGLIDLETGNEI